MGLKDIVRESERQESFGIPDISRDTIKWVFDSQRSFPPSKGYHLACDTYPGRVSEVFGDSLPKIAEGVILDWGCFTGYTTEEISRKYPSLRVIGGDINPKAIEEATNKRKGVEFLVMDGFRSPFPNESLDAVFCMNNIYQAFVKMPMDSAREKLLRIGQLVKQMGYLLIAGERDVREYDYIILQKQGELFVPISVQFGKGIKSDKNLEIIAHTLAPVLNKYFT